MPSILRDLNHVSLTIMIQGDFPHSYRLTIGVLIVYGYCIWPACLFNPAGTGSLDYPSDAEVHKVVPLTLPAIAAERLIQSSVHRYSLKRYLYAFQLIFGKIRIFDETQITCSLILKSHGIALPIAYSYGRPLLGPVGRISNCSLLTCSLEVARGARCRSPAADSRGRWMRRAAAAAAAPSHGGFRRPDTLRGNGRRRASGRAGSAARLCVCVCLCVCV